MALASLLHSTVSAQDKVEVPRWNGVVEQLHFPAKAKRVIFLCMAGGASHLETYDHKPKLAEMNGKPMPESFTKGQPIAQLQGKKLTCLAPQHPFKKYGKSGQEISTALPHVGSVADELCIIRSVKTEAINHDPAHTFMNTGTTISGRPSMGAWLTYGLGAETDNLPGFVVLTSVGGGQNQPIASRQWHSGFLPSRFQGVPFHAKGDPVLYVKNPPGVTNELQRDIVNAVQSLNQYRDKAVADPEIATRISQYEMAFRMQTSVPDLIDISQETQETLDLYGTKGGDGSFAANCLLARRLAERDVRFIQLYHQGWDQHDNLPGAIRTQAAETDQASAALILDLKRRGMLDDTLVIWGGEFGRTNYSQGKLTATNYGRDHHPRCFTMWMAGGGVKPGFTYGSTDEYGYNVASNPVHVHDLQATMLHQFGLDHERLTHRHMGRDFRLTDVHGNVVHDLLA
ncbi:MAG: DUF1501 domain-containing protein [Pirellulaceae bacterium]